MNKRLTERRSFLAKTSKLFGVALLAPWSVSSKVLASTDQSVLLDLSRQLTGFNNLNTSLAPVFYNELQYLHSDNQLALLLQTYQQIATTQSADTTLSIDNEIINNPKLKSISRDLIKLWYTGHLRRPSASQTDRSNAYLNALQWQAMGAKPMGVPGGPTWHLLG